MNKFLQIREIFPKDEISDELIRKYLCDHKYNVESVITAIFDYPSNNKKIKKKRKKSKKIFNFKKNKKTKNRNDVIRPYLEIYEHKKKKKFPISLSSLMKNCPVELIENVLDDEIANKLLIYFSNKQNLFKPPQYLIFDRKLEGARLTNTLMINDDNKVVGNNMEINEKMSKIIINVIKDIVKYTGDDEGKKQFLPNFMLINLYRSGNDKVLLHSDPLEKIGPQAIIASLSLGCGRTFELRPALKSSSWYSIRLPHNSLLIMKRGCQEYWKHAIIPEKCLVEHPISKQLRVNITFRERINLIRPKCYCDVESILKPVFQLNENKGKYFWTCKGLENDRKCNFFKWFTNVDQ